ncbi:phosphoenolpyruvate--protein phosphotransferase [bacterium]|nr:phosphoenolpyruvate--protein phosphotransferase [bacterium]
MAAAGNGRKSPGPRRKSYSEIVLAGLAASPGIAIGQAFVLAQDHPQVPERSIEPQDVPAEITRFHESLETTRRQLLDIIENLKPRLSEQTSRIFDAHLLMLDDVMAVEQTESLIRTKMFCAEKAFSSAIGNITAALKNHTKDNYLRERLDDIRDVERRVLANMLGSEDTSRISLEREAIIVAHDLTPSQTAQFDRRFILGCGTDVGGTTSHTAILSRSLEIPAVVGLERITPLVKTGDEIILDGYAGRVIINPLPGTVERYKGLEKKCHAMESRLDQLRHLPARTLDGRSVELSANIEFPEETPSVVSHGAKGVGLFRTEFLYLTRDYLPSEEEQYRSYAEVARALHPDPVIIRTLDAGADKFHSLLQISPDPNPFLGVRAIRICLKRPDIFRTQLRALLRATVFGNVKILLPLVTTLEELKKALAFIRRVRRELEREGVPVGERVEVGIMIEVPSAALMATEFMRFADFVSIGTNDLIQYVLAADRGNERVAHLYQPLNPAVIRLIKHVVDAGNAAGKWVGVCGEMAGYPHTALLLLGLGVQELSTSPSVIPRIKKVIRSVSYEEARALAERALSYSSASRIRELLMQKVEEIDKSIVGLYDK